MTMRMLSMVVAALLSSPALAQQPDVIPLSAVSIRFERPHPGGGCLGLCSSYSFTIDGTGLVSYQSAGYYPPGPRTKQIGTEEVIALVNEFLRVHFLEALSIYAVPAGLIRRVDGGLQLLGYSPGADNAYQRLTLHLANRTNTVTLFDPQRNGPPVYPIELFQLAERLDKIGGARAWQGK
jgi:Domain of unknown function (DUF6438)